MKRLLGIGLIVFSFFFIRAQEPLRDGDIIFIVNPAGQGKAIQLATGSDFTHVGIVFIENGKPYVYHAVEPVSKNTLKEFAAMSADGSFKIKRLKNQELLTREKIDLMRAEAIKLLGKHYDYVFSWKDDEWYCSEFVWKIYDRQLGLHLGEPKAMKEYNLSDPKVRRTIEQRYGKEIPLEEKMISPGDIYKSEPLNK